MFNACPHHPSKTEDERVAVHVPYHWLFGAEFSHQYEEDKDKDEGEENTVESWGWHSICSREKLRKRVSQFLVNGSLHVHAHLQVCLPVRFESALFVRCIGYMARCVYMFIYIFMSEQPESCV